MTDKETSLAFVERIAKKPSDKWTQVEYEEMLKLAKTAALIEEHRMTIEPLDDGSNCWLSYDGEPHYYKDLHTAVRAVADKIKEHKA